VSGIKCACGLETSPAYQIMKTKVNRANANRPVKKIDQFNVTMFAERSPKPRIEDHPFANKTTINFNKQTSI